MNKLTRFLRSILRFIVVWFVDMLSLLITAWIIPGISLIPVGNESSLTELT